MRAADAAILMVPGAPDPDGGHWLSRWQARLSTARRVEQDDWSRPHRAAWTGRLIEASAQAAERPLVLVGHSLGVATIVHAAPALAALRVAGAFLVAPPDEARLAARWPGLDPAFAPYPRTRLPFPAVLVRSRNDPACEAARAEDYAIAWGARIVDGGDAGSLDAASGHGPWPEGLLSFAGFLQAL